MNNEKVLVFEGGKTKGKAEYRCRGRIIYGRDLEAEDDETWTPVMSVDAALGLLNGEEVVIDGVVCRFMDDHPTVMWYDGKEPGNFKGWWTRADVKQMVDNWYTPLGAV